MEWNKSKNSRQGPRYSSKTPNLNVVQSTSTEMPDEPLSLVKETSERRNWGLSLVFTVSAILGFFPVSNPLAKNRHLKFRLLSIFTFPSIIQLFYSALLCLAYVVKDGLNPGLPFEYRFICVTLFPACHVCNMVIRIHYHYQPNYQADSVYARNAGTNQILEVGRYASEGKQLREMIISHWPHGLDSFPREISDRTSYKDGCKQRSWYMD